MEGGRRGEEWEGRGGDGRGGEGGCGSNLLDRESPRSGFSAKPKSYRYIDVMLYSVHAPCTISSIARTFARQLLFVLLSLIGGGNRTVDKVL